MQKWEYGRLIKRSTSPAPPKPPFNPADFKWDFETTSGIKRGEDATLFEVMNKVGAEGWELVSVTDNGKFYFKRPKE